MTTTKAHTPESQEFSFSAHCLDLYLYNESEIYHNYTENAIASVVKAKRDNENGPARLDDETAWDNIRFWISWQPVVKKALQAAARLVKKYDGISPTAKDIEHVTRDYTDYIVECAQYEMKK